MRKSRPCLSTAKIAELTGNSDRKSFRASASRKKMFRNCAFNSKIKKNGRILSSKRKDGIFWSFQPTKELKSHANEWMKLPRFKQNTLISWNTFCWFFQWNSASRCFILDSLSDYSRQPKWRITRAENRKVLNFSKTARDQWFDRP